jgi:hypothetical protein
MNNNHTVKFSRLNGEYFLTTLADLGIDQQIIDHYGSLSAVLDDVVTDDNFVSNGFILYDIISDEALTKN